MGMNGLKVNYKLGKKVAATMSVVCGASIEPKDEKQKKQGKCGIRQYVMETIFQEYETALKH
jgi:hypothetical protein